MNEINIKFSGEGGQGLGLMGTVYAAANSYEGRYVFQNQSYEPRVRGGLSFSDIVISSKPIDYPDTTRLDLLLCFTNDSYAAFKYLVDKKTILVYDNQVKQVKVSADNIRGFNIINTAVNKFNAIVTANMIALGIVSKLMKKVKQNSLEQAITEYVSSNKELNIEAFRSGREMAG